MTNGKAAAQAGHAFTDTLIAGLCANDPASFAYAKLAPGTKILLTAPLACFDAIEQAARACNLPTFRVVDSGHVELPDFDGSPTVTALGVGPVGQSRPLPRDVAKLLKKHARKFVGTPVSPIFSQAQG